MKIVLNNTGSEPNYLQIENQIKDQLYRGILKPNEQLPSIRLLARELNVAIITVKRAYDDLEKEGLIETRPGKGCFIRAADRRKLEQQLEAEFKNKLEELIDLGCQRGLSKTKIEKILQEIVEKEREDDE